MWRIYGLWLSFKSCSKTEKFGFSQCFVGWDNRCIGVQEETMFILYLHKVRSDREVVAETKFLRLAEIN